MTRKLFAVCSVLGAQIHVYQNRVRSCDASKQHCSLYQKTGYKRWTFLLSEIKNNIVFVEMKLTYRFNTPLAAELLKNSFPAEHHNITLVTMLCLMTIFLMYDTFHN